jgi:hypothetical protein
MLPLAAGVLFGLAIWSLASERRIVRLLTKFNAADRTTAMPLPIDTPAARYRLWRLLTSGAVVDTGGRYFLDRDAYRRYRDTRRKRVFAMMIMLLALLTLLRRTLP